MNTNNDDFNPDDFAPIPEGAFDELDYVIPATDEENLMEYAPEEEVVDTTSKFLNIEGAEYGAQILNALREGHVDPIRTVLMLKKMSYVHDYFLGSEKGKVNPKAKEYLKDKIKATIGNESYNAYGATISFQAIGGADTMDYSECGDIYLNELVKIEVEIKNMIKERKEFIKTNLPAESRELGIRTLRDKPNFLPKITFPTNDKYCNIVPPIKKNREGLVVRFAKKKK